jgi:GMP synthase-like glutamine amidotransferase
VRTLIVNCYREKAEEKIKGYVAQAERFTDVNEVPWGVLEPAYDVETYSAVIISGSQWLLSIESPPAPLVEFVRDLKVPTLGICFGHQLFARAFGTQVLSGELIERDETVLISEPGPLFYGMGPELDFMASPDPAVVRRPVSPGAVRRERREAVRQLLSPDSFPVREGYVPASVRPAIPIGVASGRGIPREPDTNRQLLIEDARPSGQRQVAVSGCRSGAA